MHGISTSVVVLSNRPWEEAAYHWMASPLHIEKYLSIAFEMAVVKGIGKDREIYPTTCIAFHSTKLLIRDQDSTA